MAHVVFYGKGRGLFTIPIVLLLLFHHKVFVVFNISFRGLQPTIPFTFTSSPPPHDVCNAYICFILFKKCSLISTRTGARYSAQEVNNINSILVVFDSRYRTGGWRRLRLSLWRGHVLITHGHQPVSRDEAVYCGYTLQSKIKCQNQSVWKNKNSGILRQSTSPSHFFLEEQVQACMR